MLTSRLGMATRVSAVITFVAIAIMFTDFVFTVAGVDLVFCNKVASAAKGGSAVVGCATDSDAVKTSRFVAVVAALEFIS